MHANAQAPNTRNRGGIAKKPINAISRAGDQNNKPFLMLKRKFITCGSVQSNPSFPYELDQRVTRYQLPIQQLRRDGDRGAQDEYRTVTQGREAWQRGQGHLDPDAERN